MAELDIPPNTCKCISNEITTVHCVCVCVCVCVRARVCVRVRVYVCACVHVHTSKSIKHAHATYGVCNVYIRKQMCSQQHASTVYMYVQVYV